MAELQGLGATLSEAERAGVVRWFSVARNYQIRPDPGDVLRAVRAL